MEAECGHVTVDTETALSSTSWAGVLGLLSNPQNVEQVYDKVKTGVMSSSPGAVSDVARVAIIPNSKVALVTGRKGCWSPAWRPSNTKVLKVFKNDKKETGVPGVRKSPSSTPDGARRQALESGTGSAQRLADPQNVQVLTALT